MAVGGVGTNLAIVFECDNLVVVLIVNSLIS